MTSTEYWRQREKAQRKKNITDEAEYQKEISKIYADMLDNIQKEIDSFYARYAKKEGITMAEAKRRVSKLDIDAYSRKAKKYVKNRDFSDQANEEMRLYNLTMKVNRLELLKANIGLELAGGFDELQKYFDQMLTDKTMEEFRRQAGILGKSIQNNQKYAHAIVNASFHNAKFSDRIWMYQDLLKKELEKQLSIGLIQGKSSRVLARAIREKFDASQSDAERLMTTELRRVQTEAARQSYERNGNEDYTFIATNPKGPCEVCERLDGKVFKVKDMEVGRNAPPMHPRCHCATAPYWDQEAFDRWLDEENQRMHQRMERGVSWEDEKKAAQKVASGGKRDILTDKDKKGILDYMSSGVAYSLNDALRRGGPLTKEQQKIVANLDAALDKLPEYQGTVYRSLSSEFMDVETFFRQHAPGAPVTYPAYTSTSKEVYDETMDIQLIIKIKHGRDISKWNPNEQEILLPRGAKLIVTKVEGNCIYMEELT